MLRNTGRLRSRRHLIQTIWGQAPLNLRTLDTHAASLGLPPSTVCGCKRCTALGTVSYS
jgi:hypothetical protein